MHIYLPPAERERIIYEDDDLIAYNKPSGLLSVPGRGEAYWDSLTTRTWQRFPEAQPVHRLDMDTSGLMVIAKHKAAERHLKRQFSERTPKKVYEAVCDGLIEVDNGVIDAPLIADWPNRPLQKVCYETGKPSETHFIVMARYDRQTRVELHPVTGRSHQLRVHLLSINHPIVGDCFYAPIDVEKMSPRLMLHAKSLTFQLPSNDMPITLQSPTPF